MIIFYHPNDNLVQYFFSPYYYQGNQLTTLRLPGGANSNTSISFAEFISEGKVWIWAVVEHLRIPSSFLIDLSKVVISSYPVRNTNIAPGNGKVKYRN